MKSYVISLTVTVIALIAMVPVIVVVVRGLALLRGML